MTLSVADIHRWNSESVREVFHLARGRADAMSAASRDLHSLSVFDSWEGEAATAAQHAVAQTRQDLDAHGSEALLVALAAGKAADHIDQVQTDLRSLQNDAESAGFDIDPVTGAITALPGSRHGREAIGVRQRLSSRLKAILAEANTVDSELASAINMADGDVPMASKPSGTPDVKPASGANPAGEAESAAKEAEHGASEPNAPDSTPFSLFGDSVEKSSEKWGGLLNNEGWQSLTPSGSTAQSAARTAGYLEEVSKFGKRIGFIGSGLELVNAGYEVKEEGSSGKASVGGALWDVAPKAAGGIGGGMAGAAYGAELGATLGMAGGPVGMVIGAGLGGAIGGFAGSKLGEKTGEGLTTAGKAVSGWVKSIFD